jgi:hypothetical protein
LKQRKRTYTQFMHSGQRICERTFSYIHSIGKKRLNNLVTHYQQNGLTPREHGNTRRIPSHTLSLQSVEYVIQTLLSLAEQQGLVLPGRVPGCKQDDLKLLPSSLSKRDIWKKYCEALQAAMSNTTEIHQCSMSHSAVCGNS